MFARVRSHSIAKSTFCRSRACCFWIALSLARSERFFWGVVAGITTNPLILSREAAVRISSHAFAM